MTVNILGQITFIATAEAQHPDPSMLTDAEKAHLGITEEKEN